MTANHKIGLFFVLNSFFLIVLFALYYSGANSLTIGTYTIIMFIASSIYIVKIIPKQNSRWMSRLTQPFYQ